MKKTVLTLVAFTLIVTSTFAQQNDAPEVKEQESVLKSKKGEVILPEAGDWALQIDGAPFLNLLNTNRINGSSSILTDNTTFAGKYFVNASTAYRARVTLNMNSTTTKTEVTDATDVTKLVENKVSTKTALVYLSAGIEKRKGKNRLQGYYGAEAMFVIGANPGKTTNEYGNPVTTPRVLETNGGMTLGFGARGFIGAEYFILPKLSLGVEFGQAIMYTSTGAGSVTIENADGSEEEIDGSTKNSNFGFNSDIANGAINLTLHF